MAAPGVCSLGWLNVEHNSEYGSPYLAVCNFHFTKYFACVIECFNTEGEYLTSCCNLLWIKAQTVMICSTVVSIVNQFLNSGAAAPLLCAFCMSVLSNTSYLDHQVVTKEWTHYSEFVLYIYPSKVHTHSSEHINTVNTHLEQWAAIYACGAVVGSAQVVGVVRHFSRGIEGGGNAVHSLPDRDSELATFRFTRPTL